MCERCEICQSRPHLFQCPLAPAPELERCLGCKGAFDPEDLFHGLCRDCIDHAAPQKYIEYAATQEPEGFACWYWGIEIKRQDEKAKLLAMLLKEIAIDPEVGSLARDYCLDGLESRDRFASYLEEELR